MRVRKTKTSTTKLAQIAKAKKIAKGAISKRANKPKVSAKKVAIKKESSKKIAPKKVEPKKIAPKKTAQKKVESKKIAPKKAAAKKIVSKKTAAKKIVPIEKVIKKNITTKKTEKHKHVSPEKTIEKQKPVVRSQKRQQENLMTPIKTSISQLLGIDGVEPYMPKKQEEYMGSDMRLHFRKLLLAWRQQLMEEAGKTVHHLQDEAANYPDPSDRATQEEEFGLELRARDRERRLIKKIEEALHLLDEGEYGFCEACGVEIGLRRLEARPTAILCVDCKTLDEIREKQERG